MQSITDSNNVPAAGNSNDVPLQSDLVKLLVNWCVSHGLSYVSRYQKLPCSHSHTGPAHLQAADVGCVGIRPQHHLDVLESLLPRGTRTSDLICDFFCCFFQLEGGQLCFNGSVRAEHQSCSHNVRVPGCQTPSLPAAGVLLAACTDNLQDLHQSWPSLPSPPPPSTGPGYSAV